MKKLLLISISFFLFLSPSFSQTDFKWDVIIENLDDSKDELYSKTKMFIGDIWNSAQDVIQNDDKESGLILVKGLSSKNLVYQLADHRWTFNYTVKFYMKDNKCRIIIEDVYCKTANAGTSNSKWPILPVGDTYPSPKGLKQTGLNEKRYATVMTSLKSDLQSIVDSYESNMKKPVVKNPDW